MYWKTKLQVPKGVRYLSEWTDFSLTNFSGHNILHKQIPGCGFTEFALTCSIPVVLSSPRKMLMENKKDQHGDDVYLVVSKFDRSLEVDADISKPIPTSIVNKQINSEIESTTESYKRNRKEEIENFYTILFEEISQYLIKMNTECKVPKIIVTYDSTFLVKRVLESMGILQNFWFVVDEFQSILEDSRFKADTESNFLSVTLKSIPNVLFVSATPMLDKYIDRIPELIVPYYELDWGALDPSRIKKPNLKIRTMKSVKGKIKEIVKSYLEGKFEKAIVDRDGQLVEIESRECVIYVNSVNHIINILNDPELKDLGLNSSIVNILCSKTPENERRIEKKLGKDSGYRVGSVPLRGEPHKMFTLCTRTVYLGADFYSLCARSFIFSDANSDCLAVDISMDLNQILGRQRLEENPWHNSAEFYYRSTCDYKKMTWEDFKRIINTKEEDTKTVINHWMKGNDEEKQATAKRLLFITKSLKYRDDYIAVNRKEDGTLHPVLNILVVLNEERSFDIQQIDYANRFTVFCSIANEIGCDYGNYKVLQFFQEYDSLTTYVEKIHYIVDYILGHPELESLIISNLSDDDKIKQQLITIGAAKVKALSYNITKINQAMGITIFDRDSLDKEIYSLFVEGKRYTKKFIKNELKSIYISAGFIGNAKATDLENWFEIRETRITINDKREMGFEIIKKK